MHLTYCLNKSKYLILLLMLYGCGGKSGKGDYKGTIVFCDSLYVEIYSVFGQGAYGSDMIEYYLTDSASFYLRVGRGDELYSPYYYHCNEDSIIIEKLYREEVTSHIRVREKKAYDFRKLRQIKNINTKEIKNIDDKYLY